MINWLFIVFSLIIAYIYNSVISFAAGWLELEGTVMFELYFFCNLLAGLLFLYTRRELYTLRARRVKTK